MAVFVRFTTLLCVLYSGFDAIQGSSFIQIQYNDLTNPTDVVLVGDSIELVCKYFVSSPNTPQHGDAEWVKMVGSVSVPQIFTGPVSISPTTKQITLTVTSIGEYTCRYKDESFSQEVTVKNADDPTVSSPTSDGGTGGQTGSTTDSPTSFKDPTVSSPTSDGGTGGQIDSTTNSPTSVKGMGGQIGNVASDANTTDSTTSSPTNFEALNPVIYTVISAAILGTLTIVAIITCWLRSRKNIHLQTLLPHNSPQDYLDFIQENEFTPMTTSEFLASLQERPPTYVESETIERQKRETDNDSNSDDEEEDHGQRTRPPPLPPRNYPQRPATQQPGSSSLQRAGSPHHRQSSGSEQVTSSPRNLTAQQQQGRNLAVQSEQRIRSVDVHMDAVLAAFVEGIEQLEAQRTAISPPNNSEDDEISALNSRETSPLLVGVVPSLDAVV